MSLKVIESGTIQYNGYGFILVFYSNFVSKTHYFFKDSTCNYTMTLKPGLGSLKVIGTDMDRSATYDFLLTFHRNHGPISYRFQDIQRFQSKIAKLAMRMCGKTRSVSDGCKINTYLESKTPSFLLTVTTFIAL